MLHGSPAEEGWALGSLGGVFVARDWLQFDALLGLPVTSSAPDVLFTVGLSYRGSLR